MGKEIKPGGSGILGWLRGAVFGVAKSGAASEAWKFIAPLALGTIGALGTTLVGVAQQAPGLAIAGFAAFVFAASAFGAAKVQALLERRHKRHLHESEPEDLPVSTTEKPFGAGIVEAIIEANRGAPRVKTEIDFMRENKARAAVEARMTPKRDTTLGHAIAYACLGTWDRFGELPRLIKDDGILVEKLKEFEQKARDGDLTVWGTTHPDDGGQWYSPLEPIPAKHWKSHWVQPATLVDRANSFSRPMVDDDGERYFDLMVNRYQFEREFPRSQATPPPVPLSPRASRPQLGNSHASVFGIDAPQTAVVVDIKNFGNATAYNVTYQAICGVFPKRPADPPAFDKSGALGISEPGHTQNVQFIFEGSLSSAEVTKFQRDGGRCLYAILQVDYESESGNKFRRSLALYLDPQGASVDGKQLLSICSTGNDDRPLPVGSERPWHEGRSQLTIREGGCLAAKVSLLKFPSSEMAQSAAEQLRYFAVTGAMPIATEPDGIRAARKAAVSMGGIEVPEVTLDTYIRREDLEHFLNKSLRLWLEVQDPARRPPK